MSWGRELWDQRDAIEKHTQQGIDFLDRFGTFVKDRIRIEQDYAKSLRRLAKQYQYKKKEEADLNYTYQKAFRGLINEVDDFAGQHEVIAETLHENVLKRVHSLSAESKTDRKKHISEVNELRSTVEVANKALQNAKRDYERASQESETAVKAYEQANNSMDLTRAHIMKFQQASKDKGQVAEKTKNDYLTALENLNKTQTLFYDADFPDVIDKKMQTAEENRIEKFNSFCQQFAECHSKVMPIMQKCLDGIVEAGKSCNPQQDSLTLIDSFKTGELHPGDVKFEEYGKPVQQQQPVAQRTLPKAGKGVKATKSFNFISTKKKNVLNHETFANDYSDLPPEQRRKKFTKKIKALEDQVMQLTKSRDGMHKMADTVQQFGGDLQTIQGQLDGNAKEIDKVNALLYQYQCYLAAMEKTDIPPMPAQLSASDSMASISSGIPPPPEADAVLPPPPHDTEIDGNFNDDFDDELRCCALYDFGGDADGELSMQSGEELIIVEDDDGSGWTRVQRGNDEGYVPTSYIQKI